MAARWQQSERSLRIPATRAGLETFIRMTGARQRQLIRLDQIAAAGLSERAAQYRVESGRLFRVHDGVFALHGPPYSPHQRYLAAHYACGSTSLVGGFCAAALFSIAEEWPRLPEIVSPTGAGREREGIHVRRSIVDPRDRTSRHAIPCTSPGRTIIDCAFRAGAEGTEDLIMAADSKRLLDRRRFEQLAREHRGRPGIGHVLAVISDDPRELRSQNEVRMFRICRRYGVPLPLTNHRIDVAGRTFYADFYWPDLKLIVEADSWRWHGGRQANEDDKDRDQVLTISGRHIVHFTRDQIKRRPDEVGSRLVALVARFTRA